MYPLWQWFSVESSVTIESIILSDLLLNPIIISISIPNSWQHWLWRHLFQFSSCISQRQLPISRVFWIWVLKLLGIFWQWVLLCIQQLIRYQLLLSLAVIEMLFWVSYLNKWDYLTSRIAGFLGNSLKKLTCIQKMLDAINVPVVSEGTDMEILWSCSNDNSFILCELFSE